jgi:hypothetical protein
MSTGPGRIQQAVLDMAKHRGDRSFTVDDVLMLVGVSESTRSDRESILRAMRTLEDAGRLTLKRTERGRIISARESR